MKVFKVRRRSDFDIDNNKVNAYLDILSDWIREHICGPPKYKDCDECMRHHKGRCLLWYYNDAKEAFNEFIDELIKEMETEKGNARWKVNG